MNPLKNLRELRQSMFNNEVAVAIFDFIYKSKKYYIAVCLLTDEDKRKASAKYALVRLCFIDADNVENYLDCYAHSNGILVGLTELRKFLNVPYQKDGFEWENTFYKYLGSIIPINISHCLQDKKDIALNVICRHEGRDPNRTYRLSMILNGKDENGNQKYRTAYNAQLASFKFSNLYPRFKNQRVISFGFTDDADNEKSEEEVLANFVKNHPIFF